MLSLNGIGTPTIVKKNGLKENPDPKPPLAKPNNWRAIANGDRKNGKEYKITPNNDPYIIAECLARPILVDEMIK